MGRLSRSQKKGKKSSYTSRFLKKRISFDPYPSDLTGFTVKRFTRMPKSRAVVMQLKKDQLKYYYAAPTKVKIGDLVNSQGSSVVVKRLEDFEVGQSVCNIQRLQNSRSFIGRAAGAVLRILAKENGKVKVGIKERQILLKSSLKAMKGQISCNDFQSKPLLRAGTASKIARAKGKKYPTVSASKMNAQDHRLGGSYRKRRGVPMTVSRRSPPGRKVGHIAAKRTGRK